MHILHLEASPGWGGQEIRILREAEGMRQRGHEVVLAVMKGGALASAARKGGFTVYEMNFNRPAWPLCLFRLLILFRRHNIDLVNTHSSLDSWIGGIAARIAGKKIVRTRHLSTPIRPGWNSRMVYGKLADFVVTTCASIIPIIVKQANKPLSQCRSIATGVDPGKISVQPQESQEFRRQMGIAPTDFLVGTACFMRSWKGIDDLLQAANFLRHIPDLKWVIIGGGHAERHRRYAAQLQLENIVYFTGHLDHPFPALASLDLFALLSTAHEGVSQAILQAAYLGKPLVATSVGGLGEVCIDQATGFTVAPFSPEQAAQAVLKIKDDPLLAQQLGQKGHALVLEKFTLAHTLDQMEEIYTQTTSRIGF